MIFVIFVYPVFRWFQRDFATFVPEHVSVEWTERNPAQVGSLLNCINMELGKPRAIDVLKMPLGRRTMMKPILKVTELEDVRGILKPCEIETY